MRRICEIASTVGRDSNLPTDRKVTQGWPHFRICGWKGISFPFPKVFFKEKKIIFLKTMGRGGFGGGAWRGRAANVAVEVSEFPAWVRDCDKDFKEKACTLTHEGRTLGKWRAFIGRLEASSTNMFRRAARHRCSACQAATRSSGRSKKLKHNYGMPPLAVLIETDGCTCHEDIRSFLPDLDTAFVPSELLAPTKPVATGKRKKVQGAGAAARIRSSRVKLESGLSPYQFIHSNPANPALFFYTDMFF